MPYYFVTNILISLAPEFGRAAGITVPILASTALLIYCPAAWVGETLAVLVSRSLQRRILTIALFMAVNAVLVVAYLSLRGLTETLLYILCAIMGLSNFFVLLLFTAVEQFGTNMRATAGTSALATGRATLIITNSLFLFLRGNGLDLVAAAGWTAAFVFSIGFFSLFGLRETYGKSIDFLEPTFTPKPE